MPPVNLVTLQPSVRSRWLGFTQQFEGLTLWMYPDVKGYVTIGYGCLIDPYVPPILIFRHKEGSPASNSEVNAEFKNVKALAHRAGLGGGAFRDWTELRATEESVRALCWQRLDSLATVLGIHFPDFSRWPADAQLATLSMGWALGGNFPLHFPMFTLGALDQNWEVCRDECHIDETGNPGVAPRNKANRTLFDSLVT